MSSPIQGPTKHLPISVNIVARNEELKIERALRSVKPLASEIIFVHDGSCTDSTLTIARRYTKQIFVRRYVGEAEPHRKFAISKSHHNWILQLDADEYVTPALAKQLPLLIQDTTCSGYRFRWNVSYSDEQPRINYKLALYQKERISRYYGIPHEVVTLRGKIKTYNELELGHDRTRSQRRTNHSTRNWPVIQGKYLAKYKFHFVPNFLLPSGFLIYPMLGTLISMLRGTIAVKDIPGCYDYHIRLWRSFSAQRLKQGGRRNGGKR